jgi:hypothetical protein
MGSEWSWPCGDREKVKYRPSIHEPAMLGRREQLRKFEFHSIHVRIIAIEFLQSELEKHLYDYYPFCIFNHPLYPSDSIIVYKKQPESIIISNKAYFTDFPLSGTLPATWKPILESEIQSKLSCGDSFLGIVSVPSNFFICFHNQTLASSSSSSIRLLLISQLSKLNLESLLNSSGFDFCGLIPYQSSYLVILQAESPKPGKYYVYELSPDPDKFVLEQQLLKKIETCMDNNLDFCGVALDCSSLFLIFKLPPLL